MTFKVEDSRDISLINLGQLARGEAKAYSVVFIYGVYAHGSITSSQRGGDLTHRAPKPIIDFFPLIPIQFCVRIGSA